MEYRRLGRTDISVGVIGLGTEHLERSPDVMDAVLHTAVEAQANYVDLNYNDVHSAAWFWDDFTPTLRAHRDKLVLAAHWGPNRTGEPGRCRTAFDEVLERIGNGYAEVAVIAIVDSQKQWENDVQAAIEHLTEYKDQGKIGHIGISSHTAPIAKMAVESGLIDVLMFGVNLVGHDDQARREVAQACAEHDVGLVAMKPFHGGVLLGLGGRPSGITPVQCISYVLSQPVSTTVPGAANVEQLQAALRYLEASEEERDFRPALDLPRLLESQCVYCRHCHPCPQDISISDVLFIADYARYGVSDELRAWYGSMKANASHCTECGDCLDRCPYKVDIIGRMRETAALFEPAR